MRLLPISDDLTGAAEAVAEALRAEELRVEVDDRSETLSYRIRDGEMQKTPYIGVIGKREAEAGTVAVRKRGAEKKQVVMPVADFLAQVLEEDRSRTLK